MPKCRDVPGNRVQINDGARTATRQRIDRGQFGSAISVIPAPASPARPRFRAEDHSRQVQACPDPARAALPHGSPRDPEIRRIDQRQALREECADHAGQHIATPAGGKRRRGVGRADNNRPSVTIVGAPFSRTTCRKRLAAATATRSGLARTSSGDISIRRPNSPTCGVRISRFCGNSCPPISIFASAFRPSASTKIGRSYARTNVLGCVWRLRPGDPEPQ